MKKFIAKAPGTELTGWISDNMDEVRRVLAAMGQPQSAAALTPIFG